MHCSENRVLAGPFTGMALPENSSWRDGDFMPKLIGSYESNLREVLAQAVERSPATVINVGCAEGYYAVGLARLLPRATVYAFDIASDACAICASAAGENGVAERVVVGGRCTTSVLAKLLELPGRILLVMDCEGAERELLDPPNCPDWRSAMSSSKPTVRISSPSSKPDSVPHMPSARSPRAGAIPTRCRS